MTRIPRARLGGLMAEISKARFTVRLIPYSEKKNAWMIEILTTNGKANARIPLSGARLSEISVRELIGTVKIGGKRALYNISKAIGQIGETHLKTRLLRGGLRLPNSAPPPAYFDNVQFTDVFSIQNRSGHGIDMVGKVSNPPPAWIAFEAKSKMEVPSWPSRSTAQDNAADFVRTRTERAIKGIERFENSNGREGRTWRDLAGKIDDIMDFDDARDVGDVRTVFAKIDLDRYGQQVGDIRMEVW